MSIRCTDSPLGIEALSAERSPGSRDAAVEHGIRTRPATPALPGANTCICQGRWKELVGASQVLLKWSRQLMLENSSLSAQLRAVQARSKAERAHANLARAQAHRWARSPHRKDGLRAEPVGGSEPRTPEEVLSAMRLVRSASRAGGRSPHRGQRPVHKGEGRARAGWAWQ